MLSSPLRDRFGNILKLDFYEIGDLAKIVARSFRILGCEMRNPEIFTIIAKKSRGTPRIANRFVKIIRDYATVGKDVETLAGISEIFEML